MQSQGIFFYVVVFFRRTRGEVFGVMRLLGCLPLLALALPACTTASALHIATAAAGAAMEAAGLREPDEKPDRDAPRALNLTLAAGPAINLAADGSPLALVVRIYLLQSDAGFARLTYAQASDPEAEKAALHTDLVAVREMTLIPGQTYRYDEQVPGRVKVIGVAAQFRRPAMERWKLAFDRQASEASGISIGFHACAMTAGTGELANPALTRSSRSLSGVRCA